MKKILAKAETISQILGISARHVRDIFEEKDGRYDLISCIQEYLKKSRMDTGEYVSEKTLAEIIGVTDKTIRNLTAKNILQRNSEGKYHLKENLKSYMRANDETIKLKKAQRMMSEFKLKTYKAEYHKASDIEYVMTQILVGFKSKMMGMSRKMLIDLKQTKEKDWEEIIDKHVREALNELSQYNPNMFENRGVMNAGEENEEIDN
ncbi:MAG: hypothetical protein SPH94_08455 [Fusobacterium necrophorum]|uniref:hypothetical protein n=1 Tax=Fusobacterium TaxID=848 RepID=UPI0010103802|nr:hypothetical protein [Fusobacterium necrophorum]MDY2573585.1 hypothetical protein [Fusobacterium necrophorum]MDY6173200.1 hypothetical protein [Fusobacterium necrophorum]RXZ26611.1 hypothetical protein EPT55_08540 [Fusobacterium necrophorum]